MPKIVTIRAVVEDDKVQDFIEEASTCLEGSTIDYVTETHDLPEMIEDSLTNQKYVKGDFNRELNHGNSLTANDLLIAWNRHGSFDEAEMIRYRYDNLPYVGGYPHTRFAVDD